MMLDPRLSIVSNVIVKPGEHFWLALPRARELEEESASESGIESATESEDESNLESENEHENELRDMAAGMLVACGAETASNISHLLTFLMTVQSAALSSTAEGNETSFDPKTYVDLPLRKPLSAAESAYLKLPKESAPNGSTIQNSSLQSFISEYFDPVGFELATYRARDFLPSPPDFLPNVSNRDVRDWALHVHAIWENLTRIEKPQVAAEPDLYTMLPLKNPVVVPGSRFREIYYWDSYWVIRGLLVSKMLTTAQGMVENLLFLVSMYGFVPNGARKYYLNRSQPPLLSEMVKIVFEYTGDEKFLASSIPILVREHAFWTSPPHVVNLVNFSTTNSSSSTSPALYQLSRYFAKWNTPRPESATIDTVTASGVAKSKRPQLYNDIATTAETGWDFSSRWMEDRKNLTTLRTSRILPADLNAYLFQMESNIASFAEQVGDEATSRNFTQKAEARRIAIETVLWNPETKQWNDYWLPSDFCDSQGAVSFDPTARKDNVYASNFIPLWCGILPNNSATATVQRVESIVEALNSSGLLQPAGIATSTINSGQQWDFPNGWAPLQHMIIEGLYSTEVEEAKEMAEDLAVKWLRTNFATYVKLGAMVEKYDVRQCNAAAGGGGEYAVQTGFGFTNGVVLALLDRFGWPQSRNISCPSDG